MKRRVLALALIGACAAACSKDPEPPAREEPDAPESDRTAAASAGFDALEHPPLAFFESHCARCHGPHGSFYGEAFAQIGSDRRLHGVVLEMVEGPSNTHIDDRSLYALVALHRSLRDGTPFGVVTELGDGVVAGEMAPGTAVSVVVGGEVIEAEMDEASWRATLPAGADASAARVRIMRNGRVFEWDPEEQVWSDAPAPTHEEV